MPVAKNKGMKLLLPEPTRCEVQRHMRERCDEAVQSVEAARKKIPFLQGSNCWPRISNPLQIRQAAVKAWHDFLKQFEVVSLGYQDISLQTIMEWYHRHQAPFGRGKERKEFPDAIAFAAVVCYAQKSGCYVAVVSQDNDFKLACENFASLLHFPSLAHLTELLLDDPQLPQLKEAILSRIEVIEEALGEYASTLEFFHWGSCSIEEKELKGVAISDIRIVAIGHNECTVFFDAELDCDCLVSCDFWNDNEGEWDYISENLSEFVPIRGTAKVELNSSDKTAQRVPFIELEEYSITITGSPLDGS